MQRLGGERELGECDVQQVPKWREGRPGGEEGNGHLMQGLAGEERGLSPSASGQPQRTVSKAQEWSGVRFIRDCSGQSVEPQDWLGGNDWRKGGGGWDQEVAWREDHRFRMVIELAQTSVGGRELWEVRLCSGGEVRS